MSPIQSKKESEADNVRIWNEAIKMMMGLQKQLKQHTNLAACEEDGIYL